MNPKVTRRDFLKVSGGVTGLFATAGLFHGPLKNFDQTMVDERPRWVKETSTICPYDASGCGFICYTDSAGNLVNLEGDPDHPINRGSACSKGASIAQIHNGREIGSINPKRVTKVLYRKPGGTEWEEKTWDWALDRIAQKIKETRDDNWTEYNSAGNLVNRTEGIASLGAAAHDNEECYLLIKMLRALGMVYIEHQARICHSSTVGALAESFGRGAMTNHWNDIANSDVMMAIGGNPAECHPASFGHITEAIDGGAKLISVDPRFTRTSAKAHYYVPMRSGTDIAYIGGLIRYIIDEQESRPENFNMTYVKEYTNAPYLLNPEFKGPADLDGLFSGYNENTRSYDKTTWSYQLDENGIPKRDMTLADPNCVYQRLKKHYARYTLDKVANTIGSPADKIAEAYAEYAKSGQTGKSGTIMYAMGTTQHTNAVQMIRSYAVAQLLLANIGVTGGGINALRGESNVQGSTDMCVLWHILPGYLKVPIDTDTTLEDHLKRATPTTNDPKSANWWGNYPKYLVSLLKAWYGDNATQANQFGFHNLGKCDKSENYSHISLFHAMYDRIIKGMMVWGQNPAVSSPNLNMSLAAMDKLDWLMVAELWETETAAFWKRPGVNSADIQTEVFLLPASCSYEKEGSITNSGRWMQWRYKAVDAPGDCRSDLDIIADLMARIIELYKAEGGPNAQAITDLNWDYGTEVDVQAVAKEVNGYDLTTGKLMTSFSGLKDDGSTTSGNWLYCNSFVEPENLDAFEKANLDMYPGEEYIGNRATRKYPLDIGAGGYSSEDGFKEIGIYSYWAWCWPVNRRIVYNRASVDLQGNPWDKEKPVIEFKGEAENGKYVTNVWKGDVPDGGWYPMQNPDGTDRSDTRYPFIMKTEGHAHIFGPGLADGPFPEHYEPWESPIPNPLSGTQDDPAIKIWDGPMDHKGEASQFPIVCTTFRMVEHWQAGQMTRNLPWQVELVPEMFVEISEQLASEKGIESGDLVKVSSARGEIEVNAMVTKRLTPYSLDGKTVHQVAMPWHWGYMGLSKGASANSLTPNVGDANTMIPEYKAFLVNVEKA